LLVSSARRLTRHSRSLVACPTGCRTARWTDRSQAFSFLPLVGLPVTSSRQWVARRVAGRIAHRLARHFRWSVAARRLVSRIAHRLARHIRSPVGCPTGCRTDRSPACSSLPLISVLPDGSSDGSLTGLLVASARQWIARRVAGRLAGRIALRLARFFRSSAYSSLPLASGLPDGLPDRIPIASRAGESSWLWLANTTVSSLYLWGFVADTVALIFWQAVVLGKTSLQPVAQEKAKHKPVSTYLSLFYFVSTILFMFVRTHSSTGPTPLTGRPQPIFQSSIATRTENHDTSAHFLRSSTPLDRTAALIPSIL